MPHNITRREFLRYSAAALAALWLAPPLVGLAESAQAAPQPAAVPALAAAPAPEAVSLPLPALLGAPVDVAIGTDGVLWALGASGAASTYDPQQAAWQPFGAGIDAAAYVVYRDANDNDTVAASYFRGGEVFVAGAQNPVAIAARFPGPPGLPPSFQGDLDGAACLTFGAVLFRQGQAAFLTDSGETAFVQTLASFAAWPGGPWEGGIFDYVISGRPPQPGQPNYACFVLGSDYMVVDLEAQAVAALPAPLSSFYAGAALALLVEPGIQAVLVDGSVQDAAAPLAILAGPAAYHLENAAGAAPAQVTYLAQEDAHWPLAWHPLLQQGPAGALGGLWSIGAGGSPLLNDGGDWSLAPLPDGAGALAVDCGADGAVYAVSADTLFQWDASGGWLPAAAPGFALQAVSVGDAAHVWVQDANGSVYRFAAGAFTLTNLTAVVDFNAAPDGTLWHCRAGDPAAYRYISEGQQPPEAIALGPDVTSVRSVASSGFGAGCFLAEQGGQTSLFQYTSPYLFKTSATYWSVGVTTIATGAASIFLFASFLPNNYAVVALDAQTGAERWRYLYPVQSDNNSFAPVYDPARRLVYVFIDLGYVTALDAQTGGVAWSLQLDSFIAAQPLLAGDMIFAPGAVNPANNPDVQQVYMIAIDAADAARRAAGGQTPVTAWETMLLPGGSGPALGPPICWQGSVYCTAWSTYNFVATMLSVWSLNAATGAIQWIALPYYQAQTALPASVAPVILPAGATPLLAVSIGQGVAAFELQAGGNVGAYTLPDAGAGAAIDSTLLVYDRAVYFTDSVGVLYGLDGNLSPLPGLPTSIAASSILSGLRIMPDAQGQAVVIFGDPATDNLNFYSTATGNLAALQTNQTQVRVMSPLTADGIVYAGGWNSQTDSLGQIFAIRAGDVSGLRSFVIESQLLQDYDPAHLPVARYQTCVTIVDAANAPQPFTGVKIWADAVLSVQIDGQPYTIGPAAPAAVEVDAVGALTILSAAADLFATPLRIWAAFMDPFERIVIYPDHEFHGRLPAMIADPTDDDPTRINLATGTTYAGAQVFTDQQQAQTTAQAVAATCQAAGIGGAGGASAAGPGASLPPYTAYGDLQGMHYTPYNTPAGRAVAVQNPYGVSWSSDAPAAYTLLPFAAAAGSIDALAGAVDPALPASGRTGNGLGSGLGSIFSDLWHKIKSGVAKIAKVVVSIGSAVYTGIQYVEDGVTKVFRFVVRQIEDLAATVGAFFIALGKAIAEIVELLSLLLHFEQVVLTHNLLKSAILQQLNGLAAAAATIQTAADGFFAKGEGAIAQAFCTVKQQIVAGYACDAPGATGSPLVNDFTGTGATAHTIFSAAPKAGGSPKSHAVAATWGFDKVRSHYRQATAGGVSGAALAADSPILDFVSSFTDSLTTNSTLQQAYATTLQDFAASFTFKSPAAFLQSAVFDLLDLFQDLVLSSMAVSKVFLDDFLSLADQLVIFLVDSKQGILMQPLDIPILSDLYTWLFQSELTFLDLIILVASIPVTFLYRIVEGQWLSEQIKQPAAGQGSGQPATAAQFSLTPLARALGLLNAAFFFGRGILMPINDTTGQPGAPNPITYYSLAVISAGFFATTMLNVSRASDLILAGTALTLIITPYFLAAAPAVTCFLALVRVGDFIFDLAANPSADALLALSGNVLGSLPALAQPLKYLNNASDDISLAILLFLEVAGNFGAGLVDISNVRINWDGSPTGLPPVEEPVFNGTPRLHLPFVATGP